MKSTTRICALAVAGCVCSAGADAQDISKYSEVVQNIAAGELQTWITDPVFVYAIREQNETFGTLSERRIKRMDRQWIAENGRGPMIGDLLDRQASIILRDRRELSSGVITEIILMDKYGLNVAISDPTSDFFQGDEAKYQDTYLIGPGAVHVSEVEFDDSTGVDQTQVSMTVVDPVSGAPIGAVTFGINLEVLINQGIN
ncbi:MAG: hypothetical protein AAFZ09_12965 [Pseudomonadota bacterium]